MRGLVAVILLLCVVGLPAQVKGSAHSESGSARFALTPPPPVAPPSVPSNEPQAQELGVDVLLTRAVGTGSPDAYEMSADFKGSLTVTVRGTPFTALATGTYREKRRPGELRRRQIKVHHLEVPLLLRPFTESVRNVIERKTELSSDNPATFSGHDIFILEELPGAQPARRFVLAGVYSQIVDDAIDRYGEGKLKQDLAFRRNIARWLYTAPTMRNTIIRPGPAYALRTVVDELGLIYDLELFYDWGQIGTKVSYITVQGKPAWRELTADTTSKISGLGRVDGQMILTFSNHCLNCRP